MIGNLITRINKLRVYLGKNELLPDQDGVTKLCWDYRDNESYEIKEGCGVKHTWEVSHHNGDYFFHQTILLSSQELIQVLETMEKEHRTQVESKIKHELEADAVRRRMIELGLIE